MSDIRSRKGDHLDLCIDGDVGFQSRTNLLEEIELIHDALPEMAVEDVDLSGTFFGRKLRAPLFIAAMTGGVDRAEKINRDLAAVAQELGVGFAFGSQRPLLAHGIEDGYRVRDVAPDIPVLGNIGVVQARESSTEALREMLERSGADALCVHLNPAMEVIQPEGDHDFRDGLPTLERLASTLGKPVIVKETGCGLSRAVGERVRAAGIEWVDTSGAGGTSWVGVETRRASGDDVQLGERFWDWGIPTAASVAQLSGLQLNIIATGGISDGLLAARAIALGAKAAGIARPILQAHADGGADAVRRRLQQVLQEMRLAHMLAGARTPDELRRASLVIGPNLLRWIPSGVPLRSRIVGLDASV